jgi:hypothetical protein
MAHALRLERKGHFCVWCGFALCLPASCGVFEVFHAWLCTFWVIRTYEIYCTISDNIQLERIVDRGTHYSYIFTNSCIWVN